MNRRAPLIAGGAFALVAVLAVLLLVLPKIGEVGQRQDDLTAAQDQESTLQAQLAALQQAKASAPQTERQIAKLGDQVPPTADLPALFRLLQGAADRSAVDFFSFAPGTPTADASGQFSILASQISVTGSYFALDEFLFLMETLPRAAKVTGITVAPTQTAGTTSTTSSLGMQVTIEFYTTDISAGPASAPGPTSGTATTGGTSSQPGAS